MDPWEVELARMKEDNKTMVDFLRSSGLESAYNLYRINLGMEECMLLDHTQYIHGIPRYKNTRETDKDS